MKKRIALLGSTGSVGTSALRVVRHLSNQIEVVALAAHSNIDAIVSQALEFSPKIIAIGDVKKAAECKRLLPHIQVVAGEEGLCQVAAHDDVDFTLLAMSGCAGLSPAVAAIQARKQIGLANKELLVCAGEWIAQLARAHGVTLLPIDSEHSAIFQCLQGNNPASVRRLILTASGGPFRSFSLSQLSQVTVEDALAHPTWSMGKKITIDSSTLMNKGLELIEAKWLFGHVPDVVIHPQSLVHSFVEYCDGSLLAQMAMHDMALPIQYALTYPTRSAGVLPPFDFKKYSALTFEEPDLVRFPCLGLAQEALRLGQSYPCALNGANEVFVDRFLRKEQSWIEIGQKLEKLLTSHQPCNVVSLESITEVDREARARAREL